MKNKLLTKCFNFKPNLTLVEDILVRQIEFHLWLFFCVCVCICVCMYIYIYIYIYVMETLCCTLETNVNQLYFNLKNITFN